jgi:hypothetical protein
VRLEGHIVASALLAAPLVGGCLPGDLRPEPGSLMVTTASSPSAVSGGVTDDGWQIDFERILAAIGAVQIDGDLCNGYSEPRYTRLFDFALPLAGEKVAQIYGLGACELGYEISEPESDGILGPGVTESDAARMRIEVHDIWRGEPEPASVALTGTATRGSEVLRIEFTFRQEYDIEECPVPGLQLRAGEELGATIVVDPLELFRESEEDGARLRFDALAAREDGDGVLTVEELESATADMIHDKLVPRMIRPDGVPSCEVELDD